MPSDKQIAQEIESAYERGFKDGRISALASQLVGLHEEQVVREKAEEIRRVGDRFREPRYVDTILPTDALAAARQPEQGEWQPIETAPKDGRTILLGYFNPQKKWRTLRGQWFTSEQIADWENGDAFDENWYETSVENDEPPNCWLIGCPTHWMPLPAAPTETAAPPAQVCHWVTHPDTDCTAHETDCGQMWEFTEGGVKDNGVKFCPYCGKPIIEVVEDMYRDEDE